MGNSLSFTAWAAIGAVALAPVGALFGAAAGAAARASGRSPGGAAGRVVVQLLSHAWRTEFTPAVAGAIAGGTDGALFLGVVGLFVGLAAGYGGAETDGRILATIVVIAIVLAMAALAFGVLSYGLRRGGQRALIVFFTTGIGGLIGLSLAGGLGGGCGLLAGGLLGGLGVVIHGREDSGEL